MKALFQIAVLQNKITLIFSIFLYWSRYFVYSKIYFVQYILRIFIVFSEVRLTAVF